MCFRRCIQVDRHLSQSSLWQWQENASAAWCFTHTRWAAARLEAKNCKRHCQSANLVSTKAAEKKKPRKSLVARYFIRLQRAGKWAGPVLNARCRFIRLLLQYKASDLRVASLWFQCRSPSVNGNDSTGGEINFCWRFCEGKGKELFPVRYQDGRTIPS